MSHPSPSYKELVRHTRFPRSSSYDPEWILENQMGPNALWLVENLCKSMELEPGMRVLDLGCGRAITSIFLAKEFDVFVWANDLWISASENWQRVKEAGLGNRVFPIHANVHDLPYPRGFFDAVISIDAFHYFGTDEMFLSQFLPFLAPGGQIGIVVPGLAREFEGGKVPSYFLHSHNGEAPFWDPSQCWSIRTASWWEDHWAKTGLLEIESAGMVTDGSALWLQWAQALRAWGKNPLGDEWPVLNADEGRYLGFVQMVAHTKK